MIGILINTTKEGYEKGGLSTAALVFILLAGFIFALLSGIIAIAMLLWNACLVPLFPTVVPVIGFWQMWGIFLLCDILFKPAIPNNN